MQDFRAKIQVKIIMIIITIIIINTINFRFCMITAAILVSQNNKTAAMLMHQKKKIKKKFGLSSFLMLT